MCTHSDGPSPAAPAATQQSLSSTSLQIKWWGDCLICAYVEHVQPRGGDLTALKCFGQRHCNHKQSLRAAPGNRFVVEVAASGHSCRPSDRGRPATTTILSSAFLARLELRSTKILVYTPGNLSLNIPGRSSCGRDFPCVGSLVTLTSEAVFFIFFNASASMTT